MNPSFTATSVAMSGIYTLNIAPGTGCNLTNTAANVLLALVALRGLNQ